MARITVTTDEGEVIETWMDSPHTGVSSDEEDNEIGRIDSSMNNSRLMDEFRNALARARKKDGRSITTGDKK